MREDATTRAFFYETRACDLWSNVDEMEKVAASFVRAHIADNDGQGENNDDKNPAGQDDTLPIEQFLTDFRQASIDTISVELDHRMYIDRRDLWFYGSGAHALIEKHGADAYSKLVQTSDEAVTSSDRAARMQIEHDLPRTLLFDTVPLRARRQCGEDHRPTEMQL